jgi:hypothetical protein
MDEDDARPAPIAGEVGLRAAIGGLPFVDQHCHSLSRGWRTAGGPVPGWRRCFTEATRPRSLAQDVPAMRGYRELLRALERELGLGRGADDRDADAPGADDSSAGEVAIVRDRDARAAGPRYAADLLDHAGMTMLLVDTGYDGTDALDPPSLEQTLGRPVRTVLRVETLAEGVLAGARGAISPSAFEAAVEDSILAGLDAGAVGLKTIAAYRAGLDLTAPTTGGVRRGLADRDGQASRLDDPALVSLVVRTAARIGRERRVPLQVHVGFGDEDLSLPAADPSLLRPLLRDPRADGCPIVLLHGHPFIAQAAYLASVHPDVHLDLSLAIPLLGFVGARTAISEALTLCPTTKLLAGTDGHSYPEMHWRGARLWREALAAVLAPEVTAERMTRHEALSVASSILGGNARRLYRL